MYVAIGGVAVGVAALIIAFSITRGFSSEIERKILGFSSHVQVENMNDQPIENASEIVANLSELTEIQSMRPVVEEFVLIQSRSQIEGVSVWGLGQAPDFLESYLVDGSLSLGQEGLDGKEKVILSKSISERLGTDLGSMVTLFSNRRIDGASIDQKSASRPTIKQFEVSGIYDSGFADFDDIYVIISLDNARSLLNYSSSQLTRIDIELSGWEEVEASVATIEARLGFPFWARSVRDIYSHIFAWVQLQQGIIPLVISIITLVASFNIIGTLLIAVLEKTPQIGVLQSIGASKSQIKRIFVGLGLGIGLLGVAIGEVLALLLLLIQKNFNVIPLPADTYYMTTAPVDISMIDFIWIGILALILCMIAAYIPARVAAKADPVSSIRLGI